jgi:uncharacterized protein (DUF2267 family)
MEVAMSATGLPVFDRTLHITNIWLDELCDTLGPDRRVAWRALGAVLRTLRDRLPPELGAHLGAELPLLVRGAYYDQYQPDRLPLRIRDPDAFLQLVHEELSDTRPVDPRDAVWAVLSLLDDHLAPGQCAKLRRALPEPLRVLWPAAGDGRGRGWHPRGDHGEGRGDGRNRGPQRVRGYDDDWYE